MNFRHFLVTLFILMSLSVVANDSNVEREVDMPEFTNKAFQRGEKIEYNINYGMVNAGSAFFKVVDTTVQIGGRPHYYVQAKGRSNSTFDLVFKVRDFHYSYIDEETLLSTIYQRDTRQGSYDTTENFYFDRSEDVVRTGGQRIDVPTGIHDLISAFYYARGVDFTQFEKNTRVNVETFFAGELFPVGAVVVGEEEITTSYGTFECLVIEPILIPGRVFREQRDMKLYVTKDKNQIPVRIQSRVYIGNVKADVVNTENLKYPLDSRID